MTQILLFSSVFLAIFVVEIFQKTKKNNIKLLLTFSGAFLLANITNHLIPEIFKYANNNNIGVFILLGFLFQILLEFFSEGIEHGHFHQKKAIPISILISLSIHAFIEGIPLSGHLAEHTHNGLLAAIIMHKLPVSIVLLTIFLENGTSKKKAYFYLLIFAAMAPLGLFTSQVFEGIIAYNNEIMAIVIGILLHISTTIIFESSNNHKFTKPKIIAICLGIIVGLFS
jgi:zinc transporter ZupT